MAAAYWESDAEKTVLESLKRGKELAHRGLRSNYRLAIDYLENRQRDDVANELNARYEATQEGASGQGIEPITLNLTERYAAEIATAYTKPVIRTVVDADGEELEEPTKTVRDELAAVGYDETMQQNDRIVSIVKTSCVWYQTKRGLLRPVIVYPYNVYPVLRTQIDDGVSIDPSDPHDYAGFIVEVLFAGEDVAKTQKPLFAFVADQETWFYEASDPYQPNLATLTKYPNKLRWPMPNEAGRMVDMPLNPFTFWHSSKPVGELLIDTDADIVHANRELNVQWSVLLDTLRVQGWATPVQNLANPAAAPAYRKFGARFPVNLLVGESFGYATGGTPFSQIVEVLKIFLRVLAITHRQSPNDFSVDAQFASGFAKLVDNLPKIEARNERIAHLKHMEEHCAWPRIAASLTSVGKLQLHPGARMRVEFSPLSFPKTPDEIAKEIETDIKNNLSNPLRILMQRMGISENEAEAVFEKNREINSRSPSRDEQEDESRMGGGSIFSRLIRQPKNPLKEMDEKMKEKEDHETPSP